MAINYTLQSANKIVSTLLLLLVIICLVIHDYIPQESKLITGVNGECCYIPYKCTEPDNKKVNRCYDCTESTVYCGLGKCNVFGCNCDDGCRKGNESLWCWNPAFNCGKNPTTATLEVVKRDTTILDRQQQLQQLQLISLIKSFDNLKQDLALDRQEFAQFLKSTPELELDLEKEFTNLDINRDGVISLNEIDPQFNY